MYNYTEKTEHRVQQKLTSKQFHLACKRRELNTNSDVHRIHINEICTHTSITGATINPAACYPMVSAHIGSYADDWSCSQSLGMRGAKCSISHVSSLLCT